ncbi:MAG: hypothetical protein JW909_13885 [Planctomycetes bacterium]|nr:hypothetical protein [Planctomycetota bacterium]
MADIKVVRNREGIQVSNDYWSVQHSEKHGGAWSSIVFRNGSGRNLLAGPVTSFIRFPVLPTEEQYNGFRTYAEVNESEPVLRAETSRDGFPVVVAEGVYRDEEGEAIPVGYRRSTEYREYGLIWTTLEIMSDAGCDGAVHVRAFGAELRPGLTDAYVRQHPVEFTSSDLLGSGTWHDIAGEGSSTVFMSRYTPMQMMVFEKGVEGMDIFPCSELAEWDCGLKPDAGLGLYVLSRSGSGVSIEMDPYCMAFRRREIRLAGTVKYRLGIALPFVKPREKVHTGPFHAAMGSRWASEEDIAALAEAGVKLVRFHNDYRHDGPYWRDGLYPPYDEDGMKELRRVIETVHRHGMKIVPYVSVKEFHPEAPGFAENGREWMHMAAPSVDMIHTFIWNGEFGGVMCLKSGWLDFRKKSVDIILSDLPWDGLYFDWTTAHPCCHPRHASGAWHSDMEEFYDFLLYCRKRIGGEGTLFLHLSGMPYVAAENMADLAFINEDRMGRYPLPGEFPAQCNFMPIAPRHLIDSAKAGSAEARMVIMGGLVEGFPVNAHVPIDAYAEEVLAEMRLFKGADLAGMDFYRSLDGDLDTGETGVHASAWAGGKRTIVYAANFTGGKKKGKVTFSGAKTPAAWKDVKYNLAAWASNVFITGG